MTSAHSYFQNSYVIRNGKIDPWGTIRILAKGIMEPGQSSDKPFFLQPGPPLWSDKLVPYGDGQHYAKVSKKTVLVFDKNNSLIKRIRHDKFVVVEIHKALVHPDGHLEKFVDEPDPSFWRIYGASLGQAAAGENPEMRDNSAFVQIDKKFHGQKLIKLSWDTADFNDTAAVFTKTGKQIPCKVHYPLAFTEKK